MSCMVLYVLPRLPSIVAILVLSGVFPAQALVDICYLSCTPELNCSDFKKCSKLHGCSTTWMEELLENKCSRIIALILQAASILVMAVFAFLYDDNIWLAIAIGLSLFVLSIVWSSNLPNCECCKCCKCVECGKCCECGKFCKCVQCDKCCKCCTNLNPAEITRSKASK